MNRMVSTFYQLTRTTWAVVLVFTLLLVGIQPAHAAGGDITTVAGNGTSGYSGDNGPSTSAKLNSPWGVTVAGDGTLYIADTGNNRIRKMATNGTITTVAGNGTGGYSGDNGPATSAQLQSPFSVAVAGNGTLYIADTFNSRIRKVTTNGTITTVAGNGTPGYSGDNGPATSAQLQYPTDVAVAIDSTLYIADSVNHRIRKVATNGTITTVAGTGTEGYSGDNGPATSAQLLAPYSVAVAGDGILYIADTFNSRIRKVTTNGTITTVAGTSTAGYSGDNGAATSAKLNVPYGVTMASDGTLYIADSGNYRIRKVATNGTITTVAGNGAGGFSGDNGPATGAKLNMPTSVAVAGYSTLYIADSNNHRIRKVAGSAPVMAVKSNDTAIANNDSTPSSADGTDLGEAPVNNIYTTGPLVSIKNVGNAPLTVNAITLSGTGAEEFRISAFDELPVTVAANAETLFFVDFSPRTVGLHQATVTIASNDSAENPFIFAVQGTGVAFTPTPTLRISNATVDASTGTLSVPVNFTSDGTSIAAVGFTLDYAENCLNYVDSGSAPSGFQATINHNGAETTGELDISLFDNSTPIATLSDGTLLTLNFTVNPACITTDGSTTAVSFAFASTPAVSFSDPGAVDVAGTATGATIALSFNATPTAINLSPNTVNENAASGTTVGALSTVDPDAGDSHTYALVSGAGATDNALFVIDGSTLKSAAVFDFETKSSYAVRIRTTDNGGLNGAFEQSLTISVNDLYEAPTGITPADGGNGDGNPNTVDINENVAAGGVVAGFSPSNPDATNSYTYALVPGTGSDDNASFTIEGNQLKANAPFDAETKNSYTIRVRITDSQGNSVEQVMVITVNNVNDAPVAVADALDPLTTILLAGETVEISVLTNDHDDDGNPLSISSVTPPAGGTVTNDSSKISFTAPNSNGTASFSYQISDGLLTSNSANVSVSHVRNDTRGDCNATGSVTAADFIATVLEIFDDGDGQFNSNPAWWLIYQGSYAGSPRGCDANATENGTAHTSESVTVADITCTVLVFFGDTGCTAATATSAGATPTATLSVPSAVTAAAGTTIDVAVTLDTASNAVASAGFALVLDPSQLNFDPTDSDGDGVPDAVVIHAPAGMTKSVHWNSALRRLEVAIFGTSLPLPTLGDGTLATVTLTVAADANGTIPLDLQLVSLGNTSGGDVAVNSQPGSLRIGSTVGQIFLPFVQR